MREAKQQLIDTEQQHVLFDLVIAGIHFDESRMIDLLQYIRSFDHFDKMPMLVIQAAPSVTSILPHSAKSAQILGACGYVELVDMPEEAANKRLQQAVKDAFDKPVAAERIDKGANPHIPVDRTP